MGSRARRKKPVGRKVRNRRERESRARLIRMIQRPETPAFERASQLPPSRQRSWRVSPIIREGRRAINVGKAERSIS